MNQWIFLKSRAVLSLSGPERVSFLQGLLTQDVARGATLSFSALLTPQGRFHSDMFLVFQEDAILVDHDASRGDELWKLFSRYKPFHKVEMAHGQYDIFSILGESPSHIHGMCARDPRHDGMGFRFYTPAGATRGVVPPGFQKSSEDAYHMHRMECAVPDGVWDLVEGASIILEYGYEHLHALSWTKGCYQGQELMSRTHYKGEIRKRACALAIDETPLLLPEKGVDLFCHGKKVACMGGHLSGLCMACVNIDFLETWPEAESRCFQWEKDGEHHEFSAKMVAQNGR